MIDLKLVQKNPEVLAKALADRHSDMRVDEFLKLDGRRRELLAEVEVMKSRRNAASSKVAAMKRAGEDAADLLTELGDLSDRIKALDAETDEAKAAVQEWLMRVPNIPDVSVPVGRDENDNPAGAPRAPSISSRASTATSASSSAGWISSGRPGFPAAASSSPSAGRRGSTGRSSISSSTSTRAMKGTLRSVRRTS